MRKAKKLCLIVLIVAIVAPKLAYAYTSYANHFESYRDGLSYCCYFEFVPAHEIQEGEPYCTETGSHVYQAYAVASNGKGESSGRKYSAMVMDMSDTNSYSTGIASIRIKLNATTYTNYGYFVWGIC